MKRSLSMILAAVLTLSCSGHACYCADDLSVLQQNTGVIYNESVLDTDTETRTGFEDVQEEGESWAEPDTQEDIISGTEPENMQDAEIVEEHSADPETEGSEEAAFDTSENRTDADGSLAEGQGNKEDTLGTTFVPDISDEWLLDSGDSSVGYIWPVNIEPGLYHIVANGSVPTMLCVNRNEAREHVNIQLGTYVNSNVRIFDIEPDADGCYTILNTHTGYYLSVAADGNVEQAKEAVDDRQKWFFYEVNGEYFIRSKSTKEFLSYESVQVSQNVFTGNMSRWILKPTKRILSGGMYKCEYPAFVEKDADEPTSKDIRVYLYDQLLAEGVDYTLGIEKAGNGYDVTIDGMGAYTGHNQYRISIYERPLPDGMFCLTALVGSSQCMLAISGNSSADGTNIQLGRKANSNVRRYILEYAGSGYYRIRCYHTGKYITAASCNKDANIYQDAKSDSKRQLWKVIKDEQGCYSFKLKDAEGYLAAAGSTVGANVCLRFGKPKGRLWTLSAAKPLVCGAMLEYRYAKKASFDPKAGRFSRPSVKVVLYGNTLTEGADYNITYKEDVSKDKGTISLTGCGKYAGSAALEYTLDPGSYYHRDQSGSDNRFTGKTVLIRPAGDRKSAIRLNASGAKNGVGLIKSTEVHNTFSKFRFSMCKDGMKIVSGNVGYFLYEGPNGKSPVTVNQALVSPKQRWNIVRNNDGTFSIISCISGYAMTMSGNKVIMYPYCSKASQKFVFEDTGKGWDNKQSLSFSAETYESDTRFIWDFVLSGTDTVLYLNKEGIHRNGGDMCSGICCDMKNGTLSVLKGFNHFDRENVSALASVSLRSGGIVPQTGRKYRLTLTRSETYRVRAELCDLQSGKKVSVSRGIGAGRGWGKGVRRVYGSPLASHCMRSYSDTSDVRKLGILADSYGEAASLGSNYKNRYASVLERMTGDKIALSGKGGATSGDGLKWLEDYYFDTHSVEYLVIAFGMNDRDYDTWLSNMKQMITLAKKNGATPILMTIPPRGHAQLDQVHKRMSQWVRSSGYAYLDYEYLMTVGHDRCTKNPSMYLPDGLHPVAAVHKSIAQQLYNIVY